MNRILVWIKRHWLTLAIAGGGMLVVAGAGFLGYRANQAGQPSVTPPTVTVNRGDVVLSVTAPGLSVSTGTRVLSSRVEGSVAEILIEPGDAVRSDQMLMRIGDRESYVSAVSAARLAVLQAQKDLDDLNTHAAQTAAEVQHDIAEARDELATAQRHLRDVSSSGVAFYQDQYNRAQQRLTAAEQNAEITNFEIGLRDAADVLASATQQLRTYQDLEARYPGYSGMNGNVLEAAQQAYDRAIQDHRAAQYALQQAQANNANAITDAQRNLNTAQANLQGAQTGPNTIDVALAEADVALIQARLENAQRTWQRVKDGPDSLSLDMAQATLEQAQSNLAKAQADLDSLEIRAPFDGVVLNVNVQSGQGVSVRTTLLTLVDPKAIQVRSTVVEEDLPLVKPGQTVNLFFDALPEADVTGRLDRLVPQRDSDTQAIYPIYITLDEVPEYLAAGMTVDASIVIEMQPDVLRLPRAVVHAHSDGTADVDVWLNGQVEHRVIQVGLRGDSFVEITGGLAEGDAVVAQ